MLHAQRRTHVLSALLLVLVSVGPTATITVGEFYPFSGPEDASVPPELEEGSSHEIPLTVPIVFFTQEHRGIYVNTNGLLSFVTEIPNFYNNQFPLNYPIIAPLYSDVDARGSGRITYRETSSQDVLDRATAEIRANFSGSADFQARSVFIATWTLVGYFNSKSDKVNTFQAVVATDGTDSYVIFLYAENGIQWLQSEGKTPGLPDARAQVGIMSGDGGMYSIHGSGTDHVYNLDKLSNVGVPGVWMFKVGKLAAGENVGLPDLGDSADAEYPKTCAAGSAFCHINSRCVDYETGFCCECASDYYGNGRSCLKNDEPQRLIGKVNGILNGVELGDVDLHSYVVTTDGRAYTSISRVTAAVGFDMQPLWTIGSGVAWLLALPRNKGRNGYQLTGGILNRTVDIEYPQTGHRVTITQSFIGVDVFNFLRMNTEIHGSVPIIPSGTKVEMDDHNEDFTRVGPGVIRSHATQKYRLEGNAIDIPFKIDQVITFDECSHAPQDAELDALQLQSSRSFIVYDGREQIVRYATTNIITTLGGEDPCKEGRSQCGAHSSCVVDGDSFRCVCFHGYEYFYEENVNGERATCIDINECATGKHNCHVNAICVNHPGTFVCQCFPGHIGDGVKCEPAGIQNCADINCDVNAVCLEFGPQQPPECRCKEGFHGNGYHCVPTPSPGSDCRVESNCDMNAECVPLDSGDVYVCKCAAGYVGDGIVCVDEEEPVSCNTINNCHPFAQCLYDSHDDRYFCQCSAGYDGDGYQCRPAANVSCDQVNICSLHARCLFDVNQQKHVCVCNQDYTGDGVTCKPTDGCSSLSDCGQNAQCLYDTLEARYRCQCNHGYTGDGQVCVPQAEVSCNIVNNCHKNAHCIYDQLNLWYRCQCDDGYHGDGIKCRKKVVSCNVVNNCHVNANCTYDEDSQSFQCKCREGFIGNGFSCVPGQSCQHDPGVCDPNAECVPVPTLGVYVCQCVQEYVGDGYTCTEVQRHEGNFLLVSQGMSVARLPLSSPSNAAGRVELGKPIVMRPLQTAIGIDVDCLNGHVYWADVSGPSIKRSRYDGTNVEDFIVGDLQSPEGVAVDWISRNIYWTDSLKNTIEVARLDSTGRERKVLIDSDLVNPRGIALHPMQSKLFWADWNRDSPKIESSYLDGSERKLLISTDLGLPNSLTIDHDREELCWADAGTKRIECATLDGHHRRTIISAIAYPFGVTNNRQSFFYTDWETQKIEVVSKFGGLTELSLQPPPGGSGKLYGIVAAPERCLRPNNPCSVHNGGCPHLCLPNGFGTRTCICPDYTLDATLPDCNVV